MAQRGRHPKYTPDRVAKILNLLTAGNTRTTAALVSGVCPDTFSLWMNRHSDFSARVKDAEEQAVARHVANIDTAAAKGAWQASAWYLERRRHQDWGRKDRIEVVNSVRHQARIAGIDEEHAVQAAEAILKELRSQQRA